MCVCFRIFIEVPKEDVMCVYVVTWDCADVVDDGLGSCPDFRVVGCQSINSCDGNCLLSFKFAVECDTSSFCQMIPINVVLNYIFLVIIAIPEPLVYSESIVQ